MESDDSIKKKLLKLFDLQNAIARDLSIAMPLETAIGLVIKHFISTNDIISGAYYTIRIDGTLGIEKQINIPEFSNIKKEIFQASSPEFNLAIKNEPTVITFPNEYDYFHISSYNINTPWIIISPVHLNGDIIGCMVFLGKRGVPLDDILIKSIENASYKIGGVIGRIEYENEINERQENFERIFQNMHDILIITNKDGRIIYFNQNLSQKTGYLEEELYTLEIHQLFPEELAFDIKKIVTEISSKDNQLLLFPIINSNKEIIPAETIVSNILWNGRKMFLWNIRDLKDRKDAQEAIAIAKKKAENANNAKTSFLTNLSYSLRIPLSSVLGMTEFLLKTDLNKNQFNYLNVITRSAEQLMLIANQLLDISKIEKGEMVFEEKSFSLKDTIIQVINQQYYKAYNKGLEIICDYITYGQDLVLKGDQLRISQVLQNLIENAVKFTDNGKIEIHINPTEFYENTIDIHFLVRDTGRGMNEQTMQQIIDSCILKSPISRPNSGDFGLGLIIAYNIVELMGGKLKFNSIPNKGTEISFNLNLPMGHIQELQNEQTQSPFNNNIPSHEQIHVIVAEDQPFNQMVVKTMLEDFGFVVDCVENGKQLIDKLLNKHYDVILMDIYMPIMDGITATQKIRNELKKPVCNIPIIAITANAYVSEHQKYLEAGINDTISKPFKSQLLFSKIIHVLGISKANMKDDQGRTQDLDFSKPNNEKFYDLDLLYNITKNQKSAIVKMIQVFVDKAKTELFQLEEYTSQSQWEKVSSIAHKMKPSLAYLSMKQVEEIVQQIYYLSKNSEQTERIPKLVANAKSLLEFIITQLSEEIKKINE